MATHLRRAVLSVTMLVVSPHLDDAVLSLGGSIARWTAAGRRVVIATVFTTGPPLDELAPRMRRFGDYAVRRAEDDAACAVLGAEPRRLDQIERAFRRPFLTGWSFFTTPPDRAGFATLDATTRALDGLLELQPELVVVPIGIGNHVDHVETLIAATDWAIGHGLLDRVRFYEDFYALSAAIRIDHPIASRRPTPRSPVARSPRLAAILDAVAAKRRGPSIERLLAEPLRGTTWRVERSEIDERRKLAAIACYRTQTRAFGGLAGIERAIRGFHAGWNGAEPLWQVG